MERVVIAAALVVAAAFVAWVLRHRRPDAPTQERVAVPAQVDRRDFARPDAPWLLALFTSETCESCVRAVARTRLLEGNDVAYEELPWQARRELHDRYHIDSVPLLIVADRHGVVHASLVGAPSFSDVSAALVAARLPGEVNGPTPGQLRYD
jgi:hypothetical protein